MTEPEAESPYDGPAVTIAYVHSEQVAHSWHHSIVGLIGWDLEHHGRILRGGYIAMNYGTGGLVEARNQAVEEFLKEDRADWLLWVDTDMGFLPNAVDRLLEVADPVARPIVGGLCFSNRFGEQDGVGGFRTVAVPTIYDWAHVDQATGFSPRWDYPRNTVTRCAGTGSAFLLVHRSVFTRIADQFGRVWYDRFPNSTTGQRFGEDLAFCMRAGAVKIPLHVHTGVPTTHLKHFWLGEEQYWKQRAVEPPPGYEPERDAQADLERAGGKS